MCLRTLVLILVALCVANGQSLTESPEFEVASVKMSPDRQGEDRYVIVTADQARVSYKNATLRHLTAIAWTADESRLKGGPGWLDEQPYDIAATLPANARKDQIPAMLQKLLTDRFKLVVRQDVRETPVYALVVAAKSPKLKVAESNRGAPLPGTAGGNFVLAGRLGGPALSISALAGILGLRTDRPVIDMTGLAGLFNIDLKWTPQDTGDNSTVPLGPSLYTAVQEQLGLRLEPRKAPVEFLVIVSANRVPTEN